ncbi:MAG TPA: hypothetical protein VE863_09510 [Pyrinomonadaceae bacterium]|jgi:hypothetical protein|nr:hypothetical protein [Pyrinomonadaceae bacterium]
MKRLSESRARLALTIIASLFAAGLLSSNVSAASWNGIEPLKTHREEVIKILGAPIAETTDGVMRFNVMGGSVQVSFISERFVTAKKLRPELVGAVLEVVLHHEHSSDTPETLKLVNNKSFVRDDTKGTTIFRNMKEGLIYTFIDGRLETTRYTFADEQLTKARR